MHLSIDHNSLLKQYSRLYQSSIKYGSLEILKEFTGLSSDAFLPLSISHGVDFNHEKLPQDIYDSAPIHWSYNDEIHHRALPIKQSLLLPHPFSLLARMHKQTKKNNNIVLLIAPPGSNENNNNLFKIINERFSNLKIDILIKGRGKFINDKLFWESRGFSTITAGSGGLDFYRNLYTILSSYKTVIGCNASSAIVFASSIGVECKLINDYLFRVNERFDYDVDYSKSWARDFFLFLSQSKYKEATELAKNKLGYYLDHEPAYIIETLHSEVGKLDKYIFYPPGSSNHSLMRYLFRTSGKKIFLNQNFFKAIVSKLQPERILKVSKNEIDIIANNKNNQNYIQSTSFLSKAVDKPGTGF
jgi:hypothetical protein